MKSKQNPKIPKDLQLEVGSKDEVLWTQVKEQAETQLQAAKNTIKIQTKVLSLAERIIAEEKEKFK